jgi:hypothetical protein
MNGAGNNHGSPDRSPFASKHLWKTSALAPPRTGSENSSDDFLANVDDGRTTGFAIKLAAQDDGSFTVMNTRNGFTKSYSKKPSPRQPLTTSTR